jgi:quinol monooxygenase YgiN
MNKRNLLKGTIGVAAVLVLGLTAGPAVAKTPSTATGPVVAFVMHPVKDYAAWKPVYDSAATIRDKAGVTGAEVFHDPADPNKMVIIHRFKTVAAAQGFLADPDLKAAMTKGGVLAPPTTIIATGKAGKVSAVLGPVLEIISHPVKDYAAWYKVYESAEPIRKKAGVTGAEVFRDSKDQNNIVIIHRFKTVDAAKAFLADPDLKAAMEKGGVTAPPTAIIAVKN